MVHPEEGTIHAWLDGALPRDEALHVETHVEKCDVCRAAVAEARGFIAASSRILSSLDDVPGQVIPVDIPAQPAVAHIRRADEQRKRRFRQTFALAATLMLMVSGGLVVVNQTSRNAATFADSAGLGERIASVAKQESMDSSVNVAANVPAITFGADSAATIPAPSPAVASALGQSARDRASQSAAENATSRDAAEKLRTSGAQADVAATVAAAPPPVVAPPATGAEARTTGAVGNVAGTVAGNASTGSGTGAATQQVAQQATQQVTQRDSRVDTSRTELQARFAQRAASAPAPAAPAAPAALSPVVALAGCYQLASQADLSVADSRRDDAMVVAALPSRIRLTDSLVTDVNGERRYLARSIIPGGTPVRRFAWSASANGAIRLFVGDSANAPAVRVSADTAAAGTVAGQLRRIGCR